MTQLVIAYAREEIGLVFDRVDRRGEPYLAVEFFCRGIMACGCLVELPAPSLLEITEFDYLVAHYIGVGRQALTDGLQGVFHDIIPIFLMERNDIEGQIEAPRDELTYLDVFFGRTIAFVGVESDAYIKEMQVMAHFEQAVDRDRAVDSA